MFSQTFFFPGKSRQHECDIDLFSKCTQSIARSSEEGGRVGQIPGKQSRRNHKEAGEGVPDLVHVMRTLASENIPSLPPGGELASKRNVIEAVYNKLNPYKNDDTDSTSTDDVVKLLI